MAEKVECKVISCIRQHKGKREYKNYLIDETCRHSISGNCPYSKIQKKVA